MKYSEKLKDPRWQKKRLEIFERDEWTCQTCKSKENTLSLHHKYYSKEYENPWEYPDTALITLCDQCHEMEYGYRRTIEEYILGSLKTWGYSIFNLISLYDELKKRGHVIWEDKSTVDIEQEP